MPLWEAFTFGGTYQAISPLLAADQAVNVYPELRQVDGSAKKGWLLGTPGLDPETELGTVECRGWFTQDGRTWVTVGATLYERTGAATYVSRGTITDDGGPVYYASNGLGGDELAIVGGGELKIFDLVTDTLSSAISLPFTDPVMIVFIDGYFLINQADTPIVWFSNIEDGTTWDALDFATRSGTSDNIVAIVVSRDRIKVIGSKTTTSFYDSGDTDTPFLPYPGTTQQVGIVAAAALGVYNDLLCWIATSPRGDSSVVIDAGEGTQTISTPPIELFLDGCTTLEDVECLVYAQAGHAFVCWTCPSATHPDGLMTICFDLMEKLWHYRAGWNEQEAVYTRWRARGVTQADQQVLVGDFETGDLYTLDLATYDDNGVTLRAERTAPYPSAENQWGFLRQIELGTEAGVGPAADPDDDPQVELQISRDGTHTWISAGTASLGAVGQYLTRCIWRRVGRVRKDRLGVRIIQTAAVKRVWGPGLWIDIDTGTEQL